MKKLFSTFILLAVLILAIGCQDNKKKLPRIAIAGLAIESSTFSPAVSHEGAFKARYGDSVFTYYPFFAADSGIIDRAVWLPTLRGHAMPGGIVSHEAYESLVSKTLDSLKAKLPLDAIFFDIHGAMSVQGLDDPEGDFLVRIRELVGTDVLISTSMDLHGSVSPRLAQNTDLITCYRLAPHEDAIESKKRAVTNLLDRLESGKGKPAYKAWIPVPILLPGEKTSTRIEPGKSLYAQIPTVIDKDKVIDAAIWMSYPWADEPRNHGVVMAYGDDKEAVARAAETLARHFWDVRKEFGFVAPTVYLDEALAKALASDKKPFIISDMGDNPTAGGAGDVTWTLHEIFKRPELKSSGSKTLIYASIPGPELVKRAKEIGVGGQIDAAAGAEVDNRFAPPIRLKGRITAIKEGDVDAGTEVVVKSGNIYTIVTEKRSAYHSEKKFTDLGLKPGEADILVVKIGYLEPELYDMRGDWVMALTPGGVDQDLLRLPYKRVQRPIYPLDPDMADPDLSARFIPLSNEIKR
ncbi:MAG TPA: M81 family metallopeptidase [Petrimonas sp.]|uniref:M81 family metallopeptidase n=1 Tax=Petrimonas sp. TaxID=2023866 RepID=UPI000965A591|nr:MAG: microcystin degradation protein MlrC [Bacteroidia bacterium 43-41]HHV87103.1 M81 family metallopeptidase [Petrimonas sp.]